VVMGHRPRAVLAWVPKPHCRRRELAVVLPHLPSLDAAHYRFLNSGAFTAAAPIGLAEPRFEVLEPMMVNRDGLTKIATKVASKTQLTKEDTEETSHAHQPVL
jgi:hypothetical protein